jgi:hypothetical protein
MVGAAPVTQNTIGDTLPTATRATDATFNVESMRDATPTRG